MKVGQMRLTEVQIFAFHAILVKRRDCGGRRRREYIRPRRSFLVPALPARVAVVTLSAVARSKGLRQGAGVEEAPKAVWAIDLDVAAVA
jgi:hypothetical protein